MYCGFILLTLVLRCSFAVDGEGMTVNEDVVRVLKEFHQAGKPIG